MKTLMEAIKPSVTICGIFCVTPSRLFANDEVTLTRKRRVFLENLQFALFVSAVCSATIYIQFVSDTSIRQPEGTTDVVTFFVLNKMAILGYILLLTVCNFKIKTGVIIVKTYNRVNEVLKSIGPGMDFSDLHRYIFKYTILVTVKLVVFIFAELADSPLTIQTAIRIIAYSVPIYTTHLVVLKWCVSLHVVTQHFMELNTILKSLKYRHCFVIEDFGCKRKVPVNTTIKICGTLFVTLCQQCTNLIQAYSLPLIWIIWSEFVFAIFSTYYILRDIGDGVPLSYRFIIGDIAHVFVFMELILACIFCKEEASKFEEILNKLNLKLEKNEHLDEIIDVITMQSCQERIDFSVYGVFSLDGTLLYAVNFYLFLSISF